VTPEVVISNVRLLAANAADRARGLLYFAEATYGVLRITFTVRVTRDGRKVVSFPMRHDRFGRQWPIVGPIDDDARQVIEAQVFAALGHASSEAAS